MVFPEHGSPVNQTVKLILTLSPFTRPPRPGPLLSPRPSPRRLITLQQYHKSNLITKPNGASEVYKLRKFSHIIDFLLEIPKYLKRKYLRAFPCETDMEKFNEDKALAAILFLANQNGQIDLYALLKTLYYADKKHLREWGRTITTDFYVRMPYGPVPSCIYDMLKSVRGDSTWRRDLKKYFSFIENNTIKPLEMYNEELLSESDIIALKKSYKERGHKSFPALKRESHNDAAFKSRPTERVMTEEDLIEGDPVLRIYLEEIKENEQFFKNWRYYPPFDKED